METFKVCLYILYKTLRWAVIAGIIGFLLYYFGLWGMFVQIISEPRSIIGWIWFAIKFIFFTFMVIYSSMMLYVSVDNSIEIDRSYKEKEKNKEK